MVSYLFGIGKARALKVLMGGHHLIELGQQGADEDKLIYEATTYVAVCYGFKIEGNIRCGGLKSWTLTSIDGIQTMTAQRCIQAHLQPVSLLNR